MPSSLEIRVDDLSDPVVVELLRQHVESAKQNSPPGSMHALDVKGLQAPEVTFWTAWREGDLAGFAALKELDVGHGEIKSMRTAAAHLRSGVAASLLTHIIDVAQSRGYQRLSLETGTMKAFEPAHALYARFGFEFCGPFANYVEDPYSFFMTREI